MIRLMFFFFQAEDGIRDIGVTGVQTCALPIYAGFPDVKIIISNSLDEHIITDVLSQGAQINSFGVGERLITARSEPVFGGVYKLVAVEDGDEVIPKIKISENEEKITNPGFKKIYRLFDKNSDKALADLICLRDEKLDFSKPLEIFNPIHTWKKKKLTNYYAKELMIQIFNKGECCYESPSVKIGRAHV